MPALDPRRDFQDDGGTRAWRHSQATFGRVIEAAPPHSVQTGLAIAAILARLAVVCAAGAWLALAMLITVVVVGGFLFHS